MKINVIILLSLLLFLTGCHHEDDVKKIQEQEIFKKEHKNFNGKQNDQKRDNNSSKGYVPYKVEKVVDGLNEPWGVDFLPNGDILITEKQGNLKLVSVDNFKVNNIKGIPEVYSVDQGGLLDVEIHPDFPDKKRIYITYSKQGKSGNSTYLGRGKLDTNEYKLKDFEILFVPKPFVNSTKHFGSRIIFDDEKNLYFTVGDRHSKDFGPNHFSQDTSNELGATIRLTEDGKIPNDNPFVNDPNKSDAIYSYGHRNVQGMDKHPDTGKIWQSEHGEKDGDEINILKKGGNYGWPIASYGCIYGTNISIGTKSHKDPDIIAPVYYWECNTGGFPPGGMSFYEGKTFPQRSGDLFVANLAGKYLGHFKVDGKNVKEVEPLLENKNWRIRDVKVQPGTGYIYVLIDGKNVPLIRLVPENK